MNVEAGGTGGKSRLSELNDVSISTPISDGQILKYDSTSSKWINSTGGSSSSVWGSITGTLSNQIDLQDALDNKQNTIDSTHKLDYSLIDNVPNIPTKTSDLTNDSGFLTSHQDISGKQDKLVAGTGISIATDEKTISVSEDFISPTEAVQTFNPFIPPFAPVTIQIDVKNGSVAYYETVKETNISLIGATSGKASFLTLLLVANHTVSFDSGIKWAGGIAPTFADSGLYNISFICIDGTNWYGLASSKIY